MANVCFSGGNTSYTRPTGGQGDFGRLRMKRLQSCQFHVSDEICHIIVSYSRKLSSVLGGVDLIDWADEADLLRAEIRLLPVVERFASDPGLMRLILGNDLSGRLRTFKKGRDLSVEALRQLRGDLIMASKPPPAEESPTKPATSKHRLGGAGASGPMTR